MCVEGWSAVAWWGGIRFADFLARVPARAGARWAAMRSSVSLDGAGRPEPYYVSIDLDTARHPQTLLATHQAGQPLTLAHGAPLRLLAPMKLGLKNIKAITDIEYTRARSRRTTGTSGDTRSTTAYRREAAPRRSRGCFLFSCCGFFTRDPRV